MKKASLWAVTSFYNPAGYERRIRNFHAFRQHLNVPLLVVELAEPGRHQLTMDDADTVIRITGDNRIWQKERLLNIAVSALPDEAEFVAWVDCDVIFENQDWSDVAQAMLRNGSDFVQLFDTAMHLPPQVQPSRISLSMCRSHEPIVFEQSFASAVASGTYFSKKARQTRVDAENGTATSDTPPVAHGIAWAGCRDILQEVGLYDACIVGGGDLAMSLGIIGYADNLAARRPMTDKHADHYLSWAGQLNDPSGEKVGFVPGTVYHCWHGRFQRRNYRGRHGMLKHLGFDPYNDLYTADNGTWSWAQHAADLQTAVASYFFERLEDEVEI